MTKQDVKVVALAGNAKYLRLLAGLPETSGMKSGQVILQPGEAVGSHSTGDKEEAIVILEGTLQVCLDGKPSLAAGRDHLVYIPPHTDHDMKNTGMVAARYIYVVSPVQPDSGRPV